MPSCYYFLFFVLLVKMGCSIAWAIRLFYNYIRPFMLYSMTGFGRAEKGTDKQHIVVEIKSVNSKSFDLRIRMAHQFQSKEIDLRKLLNKELVRGKIDMTISVENAELSEFKINTKTFNSYFNNLVEIAGDNGIDKGDLLYTITRLPGVIVQNMDAVNEDEWDEVLEAIEAAIKKFQKYRKEEGEMTAKDILENIEAIQDLLDLVNPEEAERIEKIRSRLLSALETLQVSNKVDENRLEQEMIFYLDKYDLNEEKIRLEQHCKYFIKELEKDTMDKGKKLGFILQEMGREINTLGSKANSATIQRIVIQMKNHADKVKEQLANVL